MFGSVAVLALISAFFYCVAMVGMKTVAGDPRLVPIAVVAVALLFAGAFEIFALQRERLGLIYVGILGAEVVIIGAASLVYFDESYSLREVAGIGLVLLGTAIAWT